VLEFLLLIFEFVLIHRGPIAGSQLTQLLVYVLLISVLIRVYIVKVLVNIWIRNSCVGCIDVLRLFWKSICSFLQHFFFEFVDIKFFVDISLSISHLLLCPVIFFRGWIFKICSEFQFMISFGLKYFFSIWSIILHSFTKFWIVWISRCMSCGFRMY